MSRKVKWVVKWGLIVVGANLFTHFLEYLV